MNPTLPKEYEDFTDIDYRTGGKGGVNPALNNRLPPWFRQEIPDNKTLEILRLLSQFKINTVCKLARCPNLSHCFKNRELTFMILGDTCTRSCGFCAVKKSQHTLPELSRDEPLRVARLIKDLGLRYAVITSVTRDDIADGGAAHFSDTIKHIRQLNQNIKIEVLIPDFKADTASLETLIAARPDVVGHNLETVKRLYEQLKPDSRYEISLQVLKKIKEIKPGQITKSSLILGMGETHAEVVSAMADLEQAGCDILTLGQYLRPGVGHYPVRDFVSIASFQDYRAIGIEMGFQAVLAGPWVRSSFKASELYKEAVYA